MDIKILEVGYLKENCYVLNKNGKCLIIDPGDEYEKIIANIDCEIIGILLTHHHFDHIGALSFFKDIPVYDFLNLKEGKHKIDDFLLEVIYTPGHTSDSVTYYFYKDNVMFTGDFLFKNCIGRTDLETGSNFDMKKSIEKIKQYDDNIIVYPGHGIFTTLNDEKEKNIYLK